VDLTPYLDNTDNQQITDFSLTGNTLTLTLEDGGTQAVDLSGYVSTDDQNLTLSGNTLGIEDGNTVDLTPYLDNTDDQNLTGATLTGTTLQIDIENGSSANVDLSSLVGTDDQALSLSGNTLTLEDGGTVDLTPYLDNTDNQQITDFSLTGNTLTLTLENGGTQDVDLSGYVSTDDQNLTLSGNTLGIEDGNTVDLTPYLDNTDDQNLTGATLTGTTLQIDIENGSSANVDLSSLVGTDDQNLTGASLNGSNVLQIDIENGSSTTVDLSALADNTDSQTLSTSGAAGDISISGGNGIVLNVDDADADSTNEIQNLSQVLSEGNDAGGSIIANLADPVVAQDAATKAYVDAVADDDISGAVLDGSNVLTISEGTTDVTVDLSSLVDDADADPANEIQDLSLSGNTLTITNNGSATAIDLAPYLDNTDDQTASEVNLDAAVDMDGDAVNETTAEGALQAIAPITSKAARIFYPPSIAIDASTNGTGFTVDLYDQYLDQFGTPAVASAGAPAAVPTYAASDLYYYVTYADPAVFANMSIDANGVLTYDIIGQPADYNSLINVVFVVK
jgi:hypothetical protein